MTDTLATPAAAPPPTTRDPHAIRTRAGSSGPGRRPALEARLWFLVRTLRWSAVGTGFLLAWRGGITPSLLVPTTIALAAFAASQEMHPPTLAPPEPLLPYLVGIELMLTGIAVAITGALTSPFVMTPVVPIVLAGYTFSTRRVRAIGAGIGAALAVLAFVGLTDVHNGGSAVIVGIFYVMCGALGSFTRNVVGELEAGASAQRDRVARLNRANDLLVALHGVTQGLPSSLDLTEVSASVERLLAERFETTAIVVAMRDGNERNWRPVVAQHVRLGAALDESELPEAARLAVARRRPVLLHELRMKGPDAKSFDPLSRSGVYVPLRTRGEVVGVAAIEHIEDGRYDLHDADELAAMTDTLALSFDNAMWFARLRVLGAEAERARIARDLHDRIAQSLAYVAFELERLAARDSGAEPTELVSLHEVVHDVVTELRDTLYDLRASVTDHEDLATVADRYLERFAMRHELDIDFAPHVEVPLSVRVEQELWRILQEALQNVARHANAHHVHVLYDVRRERAVLEVRDDGSGFSPGSVPRERYGVLGMRERAEAVNGRFIVESRLGRGTTVRVIVEEPS